jgi:PAS domain S-box-containing protein
VKTKDPATLRLAALIESSDDAIISQALDGTIETWNAGAERILGYTVAEAIGRPITLIVPADQRAADAAAIDRIRQGESVSHFESTAVAKNGALVPISLTLSRVRTHEGELIGVSRIARDISRQKALEREAFRLAAIVESSEDAIVSKDLNGIVQTWNNAAERMFGYPAAEIVGRHISLIIPADRLAEEDHVINSIRAGRSVEHFETVRRRKDGSLVDISLSVSPIRMPTGAIIGASKIARDITSQRRLARELAEANRVKDEFLATLSHELRTPLNAVLGYTRMLRLPNPSDRRERTIEIIERNVTLLSQLVSDVLDISAIVTGKIRLTLSPCDLVAPVNAAVDVVSPSAAAKGVAIEVTAAPERLAVLCDSDRMQQVFWNLLSNAVKFTPRGGRVAVEATRIDGMARISVADTGQGIRAESLPFLFQRFWQGETGETVGGLGLGLSLARHFIELHGGTITAASPGEGQGATFTVMIPLNTGS